MESSRLTKYDELIKIANDNNHENFAKILTMQSDDVKNAINSSGKSAEFIFSSLMNASTPFELSANMKAYGIGSELRNTFSFSIASTMTQILVDRLFSEATDDHIELIKKYKSSIHNMLRIMAMDSDMDAKTIDGIFADPEKLRQHYADSAFLGNENDMEAISSFSIETPNEDNVSLLPYRNFRHGMESNIYLPTFGEILRKQSRKNKIKINENIMDADNDINKITTILLNVADHVSLRKILELNNIIINDRNLINLMAEIQFYRLHENADDDLKIHLNTAKQKLIEHFAVNKLNIDDVDSFLTSSTLEKSTSIPGAAILFNAYERSTSKDTLSAIQSNSSPFLANTFRTTFAEDVILHGKGVNGKSDFIETLKKKNDLTFDQLKTEITNAVTNKEIDFKNKKLDVDERNKILLTIARHIYAEKQYSQLLVGSLDKLPIELYNYLIDKRDFVKGSLISVKEDEKTKKKNEGIDIPQLLSLLRDGWHSSASNIEIFKRILREQFNKLGIDLSETTIDQISGRASKTTAPSFSSSATTNKSSISTTTSASKSSISVDKADSISHISKKSKTIEHHEPTTKTTSTTSTTTTSSSTPTTLTKATDTKRAQEQKLYQKRSTFGFVDKAVDKAKDKISRKKAQTVDESVNLKSTSGVPVYLDASSIKESSTLDDYLKSLFEEGKPFEKIRFDSRLIINGLNDLMGGNFDNTKRRVQNAVDEKLIEPPPQKMVEKNPVNADMIAKHIYAVAAYERLISYAGLKLPNAYLDILNANDSNIKAKLAGELLYTTPTTLIDALTNADDTTKLKNAFSKINITITDDKARELLLTASPKSSETMFWINQAADSLYAQLSLAAQISESKELEKIIKNNKTSIVAHLAKNKDAIYDLSADSMINNVIEAKDKPSMQKALNDIGPDLTVDGIFSEIRSKSDVPTQLYEQLSVAAKNSELKELQILINTNKAIIVPHLANSNNLYDLRANDMINNVIEAKDKPSMQKALDNIVPGMAVDGVFSEIRSKSDVPNQIHQQLLVEAEKKSPKLSAWMSGNKPAIIKRLSIRKDLDDLDATTIMNDLGKADNIPALQDKLDTMIGSYDVDASTATEIFNQINADKKVEEKEEEKLIIPTEKEIETHKTLLNQIRDNFLKERIESNHVTLKHPDSKLILYKNFASLADKIDASIKSNSPIKMGVPEIKFDLLKADQDGVLELPKTGTRSTGGKTIVDYDDKALTTIAKSIAAVIAYHQLYNMVHRNNLTGFQGLVNAKPKELKEYLASMDKPDAKTVFDSIYNATTPDDLKTEIGKLNINIKEVDEYVWKEFLEQTHPELISSEESDTVSSDDSFFDDTALNYTLVNPKKTPEKSKDRSTSSSTFSDTKSTSSKSDKSLRNTSIFDLSDVSDSYSLDMDSISESSESEIPPFLPESKKISTKKAEHFKSREMTRDEASLLARVVTEFDKNMKNLTPNTSRKSEQFKNFIVHSSNVNTMLANQEGHVLRKKLDNDLRDEKNFKALKQELHKFVKYGRQFTDIETSSLFNLKNRMDDLRKENEKIIVDAEEAIIKPDIPDERRKTVDNQIQACFDQVDKINFVIGAIQNHKSAAVLKPKLGELEAERNRLIKEVDKLKDMRESKLIRSHYDKPIDRLDIEDENFDDTIQTVMDNLPISAGPVPIPDVKAEHLDVQLTEENIFQANKALKNSRYNIYAAKTYDLNVNAYNKDHPNSADKLDEKVNHTFEVRAAIGKNDRGEVSGVLNHGNLVKYGSFEDQVIITLEFLREICIQQGKLAPSKQISLRDQNDDVKKIFVALIERSIPPYEIPYPRLSAKSMKGLSVDESFKDQVDAILQQDNIKLMFLGSTEKYLSINEQLKKEQDKLDSQKPWYSRWFN